MIKFFILINYCHFYTVLYDYIKIEYYNNTIYIRENILHNKIIIYESIQQ